MDIKKFNKIVEFDKAVGKVFGIKGEITFTKVHKFIETGDIYIRFVVKANPSQVERLMPILFNHIP